jgi:membrane-anchored mycosin MYCP
VTTVRKLLAAGMAALLTSILPAPGAAATTPWVFDLTAEVAPPDTPPGPVYPMKQVRDCGKSAILKNSQFTAIPAQAAFNVDKLHTFARGDGQTVAVIDSGVQPVTRLPGVIPGGDYVGKGNGLEDCDHHGTLVAGIIAGQPSVNDGFVGVAPGATIMSIRQLSHEWDLDNPPENLTPADKSAANLLTLAKSIIHAANLGATVINMSLTACVDAGHLPDLRTLAAALYYAAVVKNVVVIAAAGNTGGDTCKSNPEYDPNNPGDPRNWTGAESVSIPSYFDSFVLSVGGTTLTGDPYANSMPGPWVGVGAPAVEIASLDPTEPQPGALVNALVKDDNPIPINGTSYAAAFVSGLAALIRELHPELTANQVIDRIKRTAHSPANSITNILGDGIADPAAALTSKLGPGPIVAAGIPPKIAEKYAPPTPADTMGRNIATVVIAAAIVVLAIAAIIGLARRKKAK